jgi:thiol:disulfide interchange protein
LALFDVITLDLSRFQKAGTPANAGTFGAAFGLGALSALLAGACVAPVLIWTLLLAADLHHAGHWAGVLLPFLLGLGMALPWPFAGAGLSFLPKPGAWMNRVKQGFAVLVLLFAFHYARLAWQSLHAAKEGERATPAAAAESDVASVPWRSSLDEALGAARASGKPVFVDLWATWCQACAKMDRSTLRDPRVVAALSEYVPAKIQCERPGDPATAALMQALGAKGLPTYVVLRPAGER